MDRHANIATADLLLIAQLRDRREKMGLTQSEVVAALKTRGIRMNQPGLSRAEKGERALSVAEASEYAHVLGATLGEVMRGGPEDDLIAESFFVSRELEIARTETLHRLSVLFDNLRNAETTVEKLTSAIESEPEHSLAREKLHQALTEFNRFNSWYLEAETSTRVASLEKWLSQPDPDYASQEA